MKTFEFPVGYHTLHKTKIIDYQLNRWYSLGFCRLEDMREAGANIKGLDDWKAEQVRQAEKALAQGRLMNGVFHYRAAEFFTHHKDPDKLNLYNRFLDLFYNELCAEEPIERHQIPYAGGYLPALKVPSQTMVQGSLVIHGGFDSFIEEWYSAATYFAQRGYDVYLFDGPGQGGALKHSHLPMRYDWEKPAKAVLDYFNLDDVTWLGISMGGWLCFRAAAYEPRIRRVIASSIAYDYMEIPPKPIAAFARWLMQHPNLMNRMAELKMKKMPQERWGAENMMYIMQADTVLGGAQRMLEFNKENIQSARVTQDVLILTGDQDHFIPLKLHHLQVAALTNARSITERIFTAADHAQNHCQVGNIGLALSTMAQWMAEKQPERVLA
ncbi:MAG: alpha/beta fold hydrolase [Anaerolineae bacterium]|nr:alpha/beta fold hydrolase [Anaerolineae bacterium]